MKTYNDWEALKKTQQIIFKLDMKQASQSAQAVINIFDKYVDEYQYSFNLIISQIIYLSFVVSHENYESCFNFMKEIEKQKKNKIFDFFSCFILKDISSESYYLIEKMIEHNLIEPKIIQKKADQSLGVKLHFIHLLDTNEKNQYKNLYSEELLRNDFELHKQYVKEGHNPNEIVKIIRNDEIEKLQEISSQTNFDFNQTIKPSLYERCSFINNWNISLIDYAAFFSSVNCFKYLLMNGANVSNTGKYAIAGGNLEIMHLCEQNYSSFEDAYKTAIKYHQNDIFKYLYDNKIHKIDNLENLGKKCILYHNYEIFSFLQKCGMKIDNSIINESAKIGNIFLTKYFLEFNQSPENILFFSSESENVELVKYILEHEGIDINAKNKYGNTALFFVTKMHDTEIIKYLLQQKGIDVNAKTKYGQTALMHASEYGYIEIVQLLLEHEGIDVNAKDNEERTALMIASEEGNIEIVQLLLEHEGIDVNAKDYEENTALMIASNKGHTEIVQLFKEQKGIGTNDKD